MRKVSGGSAAAAKEPHTSETAKILFIAPPGAEQEPQAATSVVSPSRTRNFADPRAKRGAGNQEPE